MREPKWRDGRLDEVKLAVGHERSLEVGEASLERRLSPHLLGKFIERWVGGCGGGGLGYCMLLQHALGFFFEGGTGGRDGM